MTLMLFCFRFYFLGDSAKNWWKTFFSFFDNSIYPRESGMTGNYRNWGRRWSLNMRLYLSHFSVLKCIINHVIRKFFLIFRLFQIIVTIYWLYIYVGPVVSSLHTLLINIYWCLDFTDEKFGLSKLPKLM